MKLYSEHVTAPPELETVEWLDQHGYNVDVNETRIVQSDSNPDKCYVVQRVETTNVPFERADVVADGVELILCSCDGCRYHGFENADIEQSLDGYSRCKHGRVFREERAENDESQTQIFDVGQ